jgi:hypothetical protein
MLVTAAIMPALVNSISTQLARIPVLARASVNPASPGSVKNAAAAALHDLVAQHERDLLVRRHGRVRVDHDAPFKAGRPAPSSPARQTR